MTEKEYPYKLFRFHVDFKEVSLSDQSRQRDVVVCHGAFSECTGLEATMEPKVIKAGGWNYGAHQRPGPVAFGTVVLKRGITDSRDLWKWFAHVNERNHYAYRLDVTIRVSGPDEDIPGEALEIKLLRAVPVKFKCADLNARATEVGIEELHLAHEGLTFA